MGGTGHLAGILRWSSGVRRGYCRSAQRNIVNIVIQLTIIILTVVTRILGV